MRLTVKGLKKTTEYLKGLERLGYGMIPSIDDVEVAIPETCVEYRNNFGSNAACLILKKGEDFTSHSELYANDYQSKAMRTNDGNMTERMTRPEISSRYDVGGIMEGCLGIAGESGELVDGIKKWVFQEEEFDESKLKKELGDVLWYAALLCNSFGWKLSDVMELNIEKLQHRYPNGFTPKKGER